MSSPSRRRLASIAAVLLLASASRAQSPFSPPARPDPAVQEAAAARQREILAHPDQFGTGCCQILQLSQAAFRSPDAAAFGTPTYYPYGYLAPGAGGTAGAIVMTPLILPSGVALDYLDLFFYDTDTSNDICAILYAFADNGPGSTIATTCSSGDTGYGYATNTASLTINNNVAYGGGANYEIWVYDLAPSGNLAFKSVDVWWHRQVSPPPAVATFADVPTNHPFFQFVEALSASGITGGCGNGNYCPDAPLTRKQMAAFLSKALGLYWPF